MVRSVCASGDADSARGPTQASCECRDEKRVAILSTFDGKDRRLFLQHEQRFNQYGLAQCSPAVLAGRLWAMRVDNFVKADIRDAAAHANVIRRQDRFSNLRAIGIIRTVLYSGQFTNSRGRGKLCHLGIGCGAIERL